jgi:hypothetical protein
MYKKPYTIPLGFAADPDPAFYLNVDQESVPDQGVAKTQKVNIFIIFFFISKFLSFFPSKEVTVKKRL